MKCYLLLLSITILLISGCNNRSLDFKESQNIEIPYISEQEENDTLFQSMESSDEPTFSPEANISSNCNDSVHSANIINESTVYSNNKEITIVIDPGHSGVKTNIRDPIGPGSNELKAGDSGGTKGVYSGRYEYELNLEVSQKLREELINRGYQVLLTRDDNETPLSNVERATIANNVNADAFIRIHANGSEDRSVRGAMCVIITPSNIYNSTIYSSSRQLAEFVLDSFIASTGAKSKGIWETDSMTGSNWSKVPVIIMELGFMSNKEEDKQLNSVEYQELMVVGISNGIDLFFNSKNDK